jgi:S-adenosylhomocysteine hydrolase
MEVSLQVANCLGGFDQEEIPSQPPENLPLLEVFQEVFPAPGSFVDVDALFIQHHLGPFVPRLKAMFLDGLDPETCWFVDIPYSTCEAARSGILQLGCPRGQATTAFSDPLSEYSKEQALRVAFIVQRIAERKKKDRLLVVDDGAYFARHLWSLSLHQPELLEAFKNTCVIEQTTRGHRFLVSHEGQKIIETCNLSVVSIARCHTKCNLEGYFIGAAVARALKTALGIDRMANLQNIAVIGYGTVGRATVAELVKRAAQAEVDIVDVSSEARKAAEKMGSRCRPVPALPGDRRYDLVAGCTGYGSFELGQRRLLRDGAILASGSSAAIEFNRPGFVELADRYPDDEIEIIDREGTVNRGIHATVTIAQEGGKKFSFLNAGFPVNFNGAMECLPARMIQPTHCLLYAAARQVLQDQRPGLTAIESAVDHWIYENAIKML